MVTIQVKNIDSKTILPVAGSKLAAGYDIVCTSDPVIVGKTITKEGEFFPYYTHIDYIEYHTKLFISPYINKESTYTILAPRSSIRKYNLLMCNSFGTIDADYRGELIMCFKYIWQPEDFIIDNGKLLGKINNEKIYKNGDKIGQLIAEKLNPVEFKLVTDLDSTDRNEGGFGSTDNPSITKIIETIQSTPTIVKIQPLPEIKYPITEYPGVSGPIISRYQKTGGIPIKKKYSDEIKEREKQ